MGAFVWLPGGDAVVLLNGKTGLLVVVVMTVYSGDDGIWCDWYTHGGGGDDDRMVVVVMVYGDWYTGDDGD